MKYILKYYTESRYLHYVRENTKEFKTFNDVREYIINNFKKIKSYKLYRLTDLNNK